MTEVTIPGSVKGIENNAFLNVQGLTTVTVPEGVETIQTKAFSGGSIRELVLPESLTTIGTNGIINPDTDFARRIIYVPADSYAESYCKANGITYRVGNPSDYQTIITEAPNLDTASAWAHEGINSAVAKRFVPVDLQDNYTDVITRAEFCRLAVSYVEYRTGKHIDLVLTDHGVTTQPGIFTDTNDHNILAAYALGITNGTSPNTFTPDGEFSREQAATMIRNVCRVIGMDVSTVANQGYTDINTASSWAVDAINFCYANGIMTGTNSNPLTFSPKATYSREQSIVTFNNIK